MLKIGLVLSFSAIMLSSGIAYADDIPGLEPLAAPGTPGAPSPAAGMSGLNVPGLASIAGAGAPFVPPAAMSQSAQGYRNPFGTVPQIGPDFWKGYSVNRINSGTILTAVLEDPISSGKSKPGDIFCLRLEDGYPVEADKQLIPKMSKIIGTVVRTTPAHSQRNSMPGQIEISLQTIVFPDGSTQAIYGYIQHNPAGDLQQQPGTQLPNPKNLGTQTLRGLVSLVTGRVGMNIRMPVYGQEFKLDKGEAIPIRLSRPLDLSKMTPPPRQTAQSAQTNNMYAPTPSGPPADAILPSSGPSAPPASYMPQAPSFAPSSVPGLAPSGAMPPSAPLRGLQPQADLPEPF